MNLPLKGKKALVTAGPTHEAIDPVRFIGNRSSGKMGIAVAEALAKQGADVTLVKGPTHHTSSNQSIKMVNVVSAEDMYQACNKYFPSSDITIMAAAVADYTPKEVHTSKMKKKDGDLSIELKRTKDIIKSLGEVKNPTQTLVGFALETDNEVANAQSKLQRKNLDCIVLNTLNDKGAGFQHDTNQITIIDKHNNITKFGLKTKHEVAVDIVNYVLKMSNE